MVSFDSEDSGTWEALLDAFEYDEVSLGQAVDLVPKVRDLVYNVRSRFDDCDEELAWRLFFAVGAKASYGMAHAMVQASHGDDCRRCPHCTRDLP